MICILGWNDFFLHMKLHLWNHLQNNIHPFVWLFCVLSSSVILGATEWGQNFLTFIVIIKIFDDGYVKSRSAVSNDSPIHFLFISFGFRAPKKRESTPSMSTGKGAAQGAFLYNNKSKCANIYFCNPLQRRYF